MWLSLPEDFLLLSHLEKHYAHWGWSFRITLEYYNHLEIKLVVATIYTSNSDTWQVDRCRWSKDRPRSRRSDWERISLVVIKYCIASLILEQTIYPWSTVSGKVMLIWLRSSLIQKLPTDMHNSGRYHKWGCSNVYIHGQRRVWLLVLNCWLDFVCCLLLRDFGERDRGSKAGIGQLWRTMNRRTDF